MTDFMDLVRNCSMTSNEVMQFLKKVGDWKEICDGEKVAITFVHRFEQAQITYVIRKGNKYFHNALQIMKKNTGQVI